MAENEGENPEEQLDVPAEDGGEEDIDTMKRRVQQMEAEAAKLREMQSQLDQQQQQSGDIRENKEDVDSRSVFVGNVDYGATPEEIQTHFGTCGTINRVTILLDKFTGHPKGYAYVEFSEPNLVTQALVLNESVFRGRHLKVVPKRTNIPGYARGGRGGGGGGGGGGRGGPPRGRGAPRGFGGPPRGRGGYRGGYAARGQHRGYAPY